MTRSISRAGSLAAALLPFACAPSAPAAALHARAPLQIRAPFHREIGSLILESVPTLDTGIAARLARYEDAREATFLDWLPDGSMLVSTRFANVAEVHRVAAPLGMREQLTFAAEPITAAAAAQTPSVSGFAFLEDIGGDGNSQVYYYPLADLRVGQEGGSVGAGAPAGDADLAPGPNAGSGAPASSGGAPSASAGDPPTAHGSAVRSLDGSADGARLLTDGRSRHGGLVWSRDGRRLAFFGNERVPGTFDIYTVDVSAGTRPRLLVAGAQGLWRPLDWSPDGRSLLVEQTLSAAQSRLYLADATTGALTPVDASGRKSDIRMARFAPDGRGIYVVSGDDREFGTLRRIDLVTHASQEIIGGGAAGTPSLPWDIDDFDVSADGRYIAYVLNEDGRSRLTIFDTVRRLALTPQGIPNGVIGTLRFDHTGRRLAFTAESGDLPRDVYVYDVDHAALVRWTRSEAGPACAGSPRCGFVPAELVHFPTWDRANGGRRMLSAYLYRPRSPGPHPVLIEIHGGPQGQARPRFDPFVQFLVKELGYAVVEPNVRGSSGYGKAFLQLDNGKLREDAVRDIGSLLVWIDLQPELDREHVAVLGTGYGGYLALASLADYNDRLRGGIDLCGITDFVRFLQHTALWRRDLQRAEYGDERDPPMRDFLSRISPIAKAKWIRRPLLVVQGLDDPRVPPSESTDLVATLRARGDDVWYLAARNEGHGFRKRSNRDAYYETAAMFLQQLAAAK